MLGYCAQTSPTQTSCYIQTRPLTIPNVSLSYGLMTKLHSAASLMGRRSAEARIKKWGKRQFVAKMREWGKLGGRPKGNGKKER